MNTIVLPYFLLVTFFAPPFFDLTDSFLKQINQSSYQGIAIPLVDAYSKLDSDPDSISAKTAALVRDAKIKIWPWVFINRMVGMSAGGRSHLSAKSKSPKEFKSIKGMDIYDSAGALTDFYKIWGLGLRQAKKLGAPGIVVDLEPYNNYNMNYIAALADVLGKRHEEVISRLEGIGAELALIVKKEYPDATIWFLYDGFESPRYKNTGYYKSGSYIVFGLLARAQAERIPLKIISGGETGIGYCHASLADLKSKIAHRDGIYRPLIEKYAPKLILGGTIAPWNDPAKKSGWMKQGACNAGQLKNMADFKPLIKELAQVYGYVWIYAASAAGYNPFDPEIAPAYDNVIQQIRSHGRVAPSGRGRKGSP